MSFYEMENVFGLGKKETTLSGQLEWIILRIFQG